MLLLNYGGVVAALLLLHCGLYVQRIQSETDGSIASHGPRGSRVAPTFDRAAGFDSPQAPSACEVESLSPSQRPTAVRITLAGNKATRPRVSAITHGTS